MTVSDDHGHHVTLHGDTNCANHWCDEHPGWHLDKDEGGAIIEMPLPAFVEIADELDRYRKETGGLLDTHPGLVAKVMAAYDTDIRRHLFADELYALRHAKFEVAE